MDDGYCWEDSIGRIRGIAAVLRRYAWCRDADHGDAEAFDMLASELVRAADILKDKILDADMRE